MRPSASRGPFLDEHGERFWIDTFLLPQLITIVAQASPFSASRILARVPLSRRVTPGPRRRLAAGSAWLSANVLVHGRPENEFVGVAHQRRLYWELMSRIFSAASFLFLASISEQGRGGTL
jgi:hypothetical protein